MFQEKKREIEIGIFVLVVLEDHFEVVEFAEVSRKSIFESW